MSALWGNPLFILLLPVTFSMTFSAFSLSYFILGIARLCPWIFGWFICLFYALFPGELAAFLGFTVMDIQVTCKSVFPLVVLLLPSKPVSQVASLTLYLFISNFKTELHPLLFYNKWQEHYPSCHSDSVTQDCFFTLTFLVLHTSWTGTGFAPSFYKNIIQIHFFPFVPHVKFLIQTFFCNFIYSSFFFPCWLPPLK